MSVSVHCISICLSRSHVLSCFHFLSLILAFKVFSLSLLLSHVLYTPNFSLSPSLPLSLSPSLFPSPPPPPLPSLFPGLLTDSRNSLRAPSKSRVSFKLAILYLLAATSRWSLVVANLARVEWSEKSENIFHLLDSPDKLFVPFQLPNGI